MVVPGKKVNDLISKRESNAVPACTISVSMWLSLSTHLIVPGNVAASKEPYRSIDIAEIARLHPSQVSGEVESSSSSSPAVDLPSASADAPASFCNCWIIS